MARTVLLLSFYSLCQVLRGLLIMLIGLGSAEPMMFALIVSRHLFFSLLVRVFMHSISSLLDYETVKSSPI